MVGCTSFETKRTGDDQGRIVELEQLLDMSIRSLDDELERERVESGKINAVRQVGMAAGIHRGRKWRQEQINDWLEDLNEVLAVTWNFEQVLIDGIYLPPRVDTIEGHVEQMDDGGLRFIRQGFRLASRPHLVATPPSYLNYLYQVPDPIEPVNRLGLPERDTPEIAAWREAVIEGWKIGMEQADQEFRADLALLRRDFGGMLRYIDLVARGLITMPRLSSEDFGIIISADGQVLNIGDEVIRIELPPSFQHHELWQMREDDLR
ncbi:type IV secretory system conjugative DNA transfer family protein [Marinimicrobium sp. ABcell2]|uniref:type IV secretory system conjugative DNA transfer family protein n=1 Tax=Marinimicrobium sp. ABcell2 TaxID=3069751 RepID=UPI0027B3EF0B|nr:type IV secretory system conjugative DNA transfer family protein [Marinimicrobium sp. ABcell2]MDQ2077515.1 type IV secretory system conjugative DNA transfer family protein [Marinimicrobium sp. ABcell2]